jgi:ATP-dependent Clp protease adapter protein ClpS
VSTIIEERIDTTTKVKPPKRYNIWAIDNDFTSFDEVVYVLTKSFGMNKAVAAELTTKVDQEGKAKVNPKPMSRALAQAQMQRINDVKRHLADSFMMGLRKKEIMMLKFTLKED